MSCSKNAMVPTRLQMRRCEVSSSSPLSCSFLLSPSYSLTLSFRDKRNIFPVTRETSYRQCCGTGTGTVGTVTFWRSGPGTLIYGTATVINYVSGTVILHFNSILTANPPVKSGPCTPNARGIRSVRHGIHIFQCFGSGPGFNQVRGSGKNDPQK